MKMVKKALGVAALAVAASGAQAGNINIGGVIWDPDSAADFNAGDALGVESVVQLGGSLSGFGSVDTFNSLPLNCPGCELTYEFGGYTLTSATDGDLVFEGGWVNFYVDTNLDFTLSDISTANNGNLWLSLVAVEDNRDGVVGTLFGTLISGTLGFGDEFGLGSGFLDVTGAGMADSNFDTQTQLMANGNFADISFTSTFQTYSACQGLSVPETLACNNGFPLQSSNNLRGDSIPVPGSLALLGLGLLGLGAAVRKRK